MSGHKARTDFYRAVMTASAAMQASNDNKDLTADQRAADFREVVIDLRDACTLYLEESPSNWLDLLPDGGRLISPHRLD